LDHLILTNLNPTTEWRTVWNNLILENADLVINPTQSLEGFKLPRQEWVSLNRIRTGHGRCGYSMHQWKLRDNSACDCGNATQTIQHIMSNCPKRKFESKMSDFFRLTSEALDWIATLDIKLEKILNYTIGIVILLLYFILISFLYELFYFILFFYFYFIFIFYSMLQLFMYIMCQNEPYDK